jgi:predicted small metal-binding protein
MTSEFECGAPDCTFLIRTEDPDEIVDHVRLHAKEKHDRDVDVDRVRDRIRSS